MEENGRNTFVFVVEKPKNDTVFCAIQPFQGPETSGRDITSGVEKTDCRREARDGSFLASEPHAEMLDWGRPHCLSGVFYGVSYKTSGSGGIPELTQREEKKGCVGQLDLWFVKIWQQCRDVALALPDADAMRWRAISYEMQ